jgi:hypothetical protein
VPVRSARRRAGMCTDRTRERERQTLSPSRSR